MLPNLTDNEARVIGCLMEKSVVTPDQYPLTLNALTSACNQKSSRHPVMSLESGVVDHTIKDLQRKHFVRVEENFKSGVAKHTQRFCNTSLADYRFDPPQFAIVCLLLLRGPQTPGELRSRSGRLHSFEDHGAVVNTLTALIEWEHHALVIQLPRAPGRKDSEYMHQFSGPVDIDAYSQSTPTVKAAERVSNSDLAQRVSQLEAEVAEIKAQLEATR
jgi:uncharacterized protein YceH (UPF0502 family)